MYNGKNGRLQKYMDGFKNQGTSFSQQDKETSDYEGDVEITAMCFDDPHRKIFIADAHGTVRCFNINSAALIKSFSATRPAPGQPQPSLSLSALRANEICGMKYYEHDGTQMLITSHCNERLRCWDVTDDKVPTKMLKSVTGGHFNENIAAMTMSGHLGLVATGSFVGDITVWDFELFRPVGLLRGHKLAVRALEFIPEHPLLVSAGSCGTVCVHAVRGAPVKLVNVCLGKFVNLEQDMNCHTNIGITSALIFYRGV